jgi:hypothetical protein
LNTVFLLMAQYNGAAIVPLETVCRDYFTHMDAQQFARKATAGELDIPVVRIESSQKAARGIYLTDLAAWIDARRDAARKECDQLQGRAGRGR